MSDDFFEVAAYVVGGHDGNLVSMTQSVVGVCQATAEGQQYRFEAPFVVLTRLPAQLVVITQRFDPLGKVEIIARASVKCIGLIPGYEPIVGTILHWAGTGDDQIGLELTVEDALRRGREAFE